MSDDPERPEPENPFGIDLQRITSGPMYFAPDGTPIDGVLEWAELVRKRNETADRAESWWRKRTQISPDVEVSTVWIGLDHSFGFGPPLFWETMIFGGEHDCEQWRYPSRETALDDHERIVAALRAGRSPLDGDE